MDEIDIVLRRAASAPVPTRLAATEALVLSRVSGHSFATRELPIGFRATAMAAALVMGVAGGLMPAEPAAAEQSLSPIGGAAEFAPSTLLTGGW
jgi:hypothetical protein